MADTFSSGAVSIFPTSLGWFGLYSEDSVLSALTFGQRSADEVRHWLQRQHLPAWTESHWSPELKRRLESFADGGADDFTDVAVVRPASQSEFQSRVVDVVRVIRYGLTLSYAEVARLAGSPGAARAVGRVMATNSIPIVIPCHRVVGAQGKLGGYSAPNGLTMKQHLLRMEAEVAHTHQCRSQWERTMQVHSA